MPYYDTWELAKEAFNKLEPPKEGDWMGTFHKDASGYWVSNERNLIKE